MPTRLRSVLFTPGNEERKLRRAMEAGADAVVADLEDSVALDGKARARDVVAATFGTPPAGPARFVRVNSEPELLAADLRALAGVELDGIVLPKATANSVAALGGRPHIPIVETATGLLETRAIARSPNVLALLLGTLDLSVDLRLRPRADGLELLVPSATLVIESVAARIGPPIDGVHATVADLTGLEERALAARALGFGGKACIHPSHVPVINAVFRPTEEELEQAREIVAAYEHGAASGRGVVAHAGRMVDLPVVEQARQMLADRDEGAS